MASYLGNVFYWTFWCVAFPLWAVGKSGILGAIRGLGNGNRRDRRPGPAEWVALAVPVLIPLYIIPLASASGVGLPAVADLGYGVPVWIPVLFASILNGVLEEILWRGTYLAAFPRDRTLGFVFPSVMFGLWHLSPFSFLAGVGVAELAVIAAVGTLFGLCWGGVAQRTGNIRWSIYSHVLSNIVLLGSIVAA